MMNRDFLKLRSDSKVSNLGFSFKGPSWLPIFTLLLTLIWSPPNNIHYIIFLLLHPPLSSPASRVVTTIVENTDIKPPQRS